METFYCIAECLFQSVQPYSTLILKLEPFTTSTLLAIHPQIFLLFLYRVVIQALRTQALLVQLLSLLVWQAANVPLFRAEECQLKIGVVLSNQLSKAHLKSHTNCIRPAPNTSYQHIRLATKFLQALLSGLLTNDCLEFPHLHRHIQRSVCVSKAFLKKQQFLIKHEVT